MANSKKVPPVPFNASHTLITKAAEARPAGLKRRPKSVAEFAADARDIVQRAGVLEWLGRVVVGLEPAPITARLDATKILLDRGLGRPLERMIVGSDSGQLAAELSDEQLVAALRQIGPAQGASVAGSVVPGALQADNTAEVEADWTDDKRIANPSIPAIPSETHAQHTPTHMAPPELGKDHANASSASDDAVRDGGGTPGLGPLNSRAGKPD